eukprot:TRINITY_DN876_c2_g1_i1.p1 TRINITY_DN876_c2_g1~~TRINITY_DN876_c2_g1_i1.p1  ORF type:complete len:171 (+),score=45.10 TRINITY_DN876_c2_g1_i1:154-666(+)
MTYPLDLVRARLTAQTTTRHYTGVGHAFSSIVKSEGYIGLYKGIRPTLLGIAPYNGINFATYEFLKQKFMKDKDRKEHPIGHLLCGAGSGAVAQTFTYPIDLIRRRMQMVGMPGTTTQYNSILHCAQSVVAEEGVKGLYRGMVACYLKVVPGMAVSFMTYEFMKGVLDIE